MADSTRPLSAFLVDWAVAPIAQLIAVILERLIKAVQHRPRFVTGGTTESILSGQGGDGLRRTDNDKPCHQEQYS